MNLKFFTSFVIASLLVTLVAPMIPKAFAASEGDVVINEIAWAGSADSSGEEWIELYNNADSDIDLTDWVIVDDDSSTYRLSGTIAAKSYFVIEDSEDAITSSDADAVIGISLANAGDKLVLKDDSSSTIDVVNNSGGAWYAGSNESKATMERIDSAAMIDDPDNWADNTQSNGATSSGGSEIQGTPGTKNSVSELAEDATQVTFTASNSTPDAGEEITFSVDVENAENLFSYGFDLSYDPTVLEYKSAAKGPFLSEDGAVTTAFNAGLENNEEGTIIVGEARLMADKAGVGGEGQLFQMLFEVVGNEADNTTLEVSGGSFLASPDSDIEAEFHEAEITIASGENFVNPVENLEADQAEERYAITLSWTAPAGGADSYKVMRQDQMGEFREIGETEETSFADRDENEAGGKIIPQLAYTYRVVAVKGGDQSTGREVSVADDRGLAGDNDRSDRVDARDLENLAKLFGLSMDDAKYAALVDTTYDGTINGSDLIDIGANWALTYSE